MTSTLLLLFCCDNNTITLHIEDNVAFRRYILVWKRTNIHSKNNTKKVLRQIIIGFKFTKYIQMVERYYQKIYTHYALSLFRQYFIWTCVIPIQTCNCFFLSYFWCPTWTLLYLFYILTNWIMYCPWCWVKPTHNVFCWNVLPISPKS